MTESALFAFTLEQMEGVGRVTAGRILSHFPTYPELRRYPREQILLRIKGAPNAAALVGRLLDPEAMQDRLDQAKNQLKSYQKRQIEWLCFHDAHWPAKLNDLPRAQRPNLLYTYGKTERLAGPAVAFLASPTLEPEPFELAQDLVQFLIKHRISPIAGLSTGFDVVVHRISATSPEAYPSIMVAGTGLAKIEHKVRSQASQSVKAGGVLLSSFSVTHGPFSHDDRERALVQVAMAGAIVLVDIKPDTSEWSAMEWALEAKRSVFSLGAGSESFPTAVHQLQSAADFEWVRVAISEVE